ncbi:synaptonemal complex central element protein 3 [Dunckerocampus dactyliophorus]|uniref:synaptonemal complex central element protein 3 n=1 Tax=Dunckerocampus dactyliophorus TaxID=161453 RepID=UPI0024076E69|nr:synaptonemal complex central element protein 3 [Dunckerocampus dactyliophorus]
MAVRVVVVDMLVGQMTDSTTPPGVKKSAEDSLELNDFLERMTEDMENISVQLTWMAYDMVALRTNPQLWSSMQQLEEAHRQCSVAVKGNPPQELRSQI